MPRRGSTWVSVRFGALWLAAGALESVFLLRMGTDLAVALSCHLLAAASLWISVSRSGVGGRWRHPFLTFTLFLPLLGWGLAALLFWGRIPQAIDVSPEEDLPFTTGSAAVRAFGDPRLSHRERVLQALDFIPLTDILAGDDVELKRGAVEKLAQLKNPEAIGLLLHYRSNPQAELRFYVTAALTRIKKEYDEELEAAKRELQKARDTARARLFLARVYVQYAGSGLLDEAMAASYRGEALYHLGEIATAQGTDPAVQGEAGRMRLDILMADRSWDQGLAVIAALQARDLGDPGELAKARVQIFYQSGRYAEVAAELAALKAQGLLDKEWRMLADWWGGS